ncbi:MAG: inositol monophosphatase family protein [Verrucomicrobiaceae bacterium]|nr:inositol monophosphatase family protein [Verrucomicrobiaceae bacterium]
MDLSALTKQALQAARDAGRLIGSCRGREVDIIHKDAGNTLASQVVTEVDHKAQEAILEVLMPTCRDLDIALLAEEEADDERRLECDYFWCVDPLDGTLPFIQGQPGYSVSIGLVARDGSPQIGVVYDPVNDVLYQATRGQGLRRNNEPWVPGSSGQELTFTYDRSLAQHPFFDEILQQLDSYGHLLGLNGLVASQYGGAVMNACYALENAPACHFKFPKPQDGGGSLWDYAATACIYQEAGAIVSDVQGNPLELNRAGSTFMNHRGALYATDDALARRVREIITTFQARS